MKVLTGAQHVALDRHTIEHEPIESIDLMERAAVGIAAEISSRWDVHRTVFVFAGAGNNGGDGLAVARLLAQQGYRVAVYLFNVKAKLSEDCTINRDRLLAMIENGDYQDHLVLKEISQGFDFPKVRERDIVIDALFGTGLRSPLSGGFAVVARKINSIRTHVVSIDLPSGLMSENNEFTDRSCVVHAELTLTIGCPKLAFLLADNESCVGEWKTIDIGYSPEAVEQTNSPYSLLELDDVRELLRPRSRFGHKGTFGHALLIAGSYGMGGAAILAARGCLRGGVGKLSIHSSYCNHTILQMGIPEAVLLADKNNRCISEALDTSRYQAIGIGPGLGRNESTATALQQYIALADDPMVIDADALNLLGEHREWMSYIPTDSILTPHVKELENLIGSCANSYERLSRASDLAIHARIFVILKGHYTAICTPQGRILFCPRGNSGMATPGSGDVLTGLLTSLLAQGYTPSEAAQLGVWLHATAGDLAAQDLGEESLMASDLITYLGAAFQELKHPNPTL